MKGTVDRFGKLHCCLILRNCHSHPQPSATTTLINHHPHQSATINIEARPSINKNITTR
jgi:hypothetical protein